MKKNNHSYVSMYDVCFAVLQQWTLMHKADNHTCGLLTEGQQPKFASSIRLLKTEGHIGPRKEDLRQDVVCANM